MLSYRSAASSLRVLSLFFVNDTATTEIYTLSLHDALPIYRQAHDRDGGERGVLAQRAAGVANVLEEGVHAGVRRAGGRRSEEHTSELQSLQYIVCRLLLAKKKTRLSRSRSPQFYANTTHRR